MADKCPYKYKYELVDWLVNMYGWTKSRANSMKKKQLYAIYYDKDLFHNRVKTNLNITYFDYLHKLEKEGKFEQSY